MAARSKRSADERRLAQLREIANEGANRNCLECHQRGPTYVDMTIGSFVCTKCCGLLRGLNPPHRTKSITMTTFSDDELEFIKNRGNEFNRYVYLGTYDERSNLEKESLREEHKIKEFMVQKYERKRWFVDPDIAQHKMQLDRRQRAAAEQGVSLTGGSISKPSSKPPATFATRSQPVTPAGGELWSPAAPINSFVAPQTTLQNNAFTDDLFVLCKEAIPPPADPFQTSSASTPKEQQAFRKSSSSSSSAGVDSFGMSTTTSPFGAFTASATTVSGLLPQPPNQQTTANNAAAGDFADFDAAFGPPVPLLPSTATTKSSAGKAPSGDGPATAAAAPSADRYAALAELDEIFSGQKTDSTLNTTENITGSIPPVDPWGNQQATLVVQANPFSPTGPTAATPSGSNNPWGSPSAPGAAPTSSPNPFAMAANSWPVPAASTTAASSQPINFGRLTPSSALTTAVAGVQLNNGRVTPTMSQWPANGQASATALSSTGGTPSVNSVGGFPSAWPSTSPLQQNVFVSSQQTLPFVAATTTTTMATRSNSTSSSCSGTGSISGRGGSSSQGGGDWATFGQLAWPNGTTTTPTATGGWPNGTVSAGTPWPQIPSSASTPAFNARSNSPSLQGLTMPVTSKGTGGVPQSFSTHSAFGTAQWPPNGSLNGTYQSGLSHQNGRTSSTANPFSPNGSGPLSTTRVCSTSNPFL